MSDPYASIAVPADPYAAIAKPVKKSAEKPAAKKSTGADMFTSALSGVSRSVLGMYDSAMGPSAGPLGILAATAEAGAEALGRKEPQKVRSLLAGPEPETRAGRYTRSVFEMAPAALMPARGGASFLAQ